MVGHTKVRADNACVGEFLQNRHVRVLVVVAPKILEDRTQPLYACECE
jgi:hypothetical protein